MKICPKCKNGNPDDAMLCSECFAGLANTKISDEGNIAAEIFEKQEKAEKLSRNIHLLLIPLYYLLLVPLAVLCIMHEPEVWFVFLIFAFFPVMYYLCIFKPDTMFKLEHLFCINNIDDVEPSDWYYFSNRIGGYLFLIFGIAMAVYLYFKL